MNEEVRTMPCCGYHVEAGEVGPIYWNPYNAVVQCHNCGSSYILVKNAKAKRKQLRDRLRFDLFRRAKEAYPKLTFREFLMHPYFKERMEANGL